MRFRHSMRFEKVFVEITNFCGLNCTFCTPPKDSKDIMPLKLFDRIVKEIQPYTKLCALHILGDPLTLDNLQEYLDCAQNLKIEITTSGFYLNPQNTALLLNHPNIHQINFSLTSALYQKKQVDLDSYLAPILDFCATHRRLKSEKFINLRLWNLNQNLSAPSKNAKLYQILQDFFCLDRITPTKTRLAYKIHLIGAPFFEWANTDAPPQHNSGFCYGASKQLGILCNGIVVPCCFDTKGAINLGNIRTQNLQEILHTPRIQALIEGFKQGKRIESLCQNCSYLTQHR